MTIEFQAIFIRKPIHIKSAVWQETSHQWKVLINGQDFDYYTGSGLIDENKSPKKPTLDDVLHSLLSDYDAMKISFYEWCDNYGYERDSIAAQRVYMDCQANGLKLNKTGIDIAAERERLQDY